MKSRSHAGWTDNLHDAYPEIQHQNSCQADKHPKQKTVIWPVTRILPPRLGIVEEMSVRWDLDVRWTGSCTHGFRQWGEQNNLYVGTRVLCYSLLKSSYFGELETWSQIA